MDRFEWSDGLLAPAEMLVAQQPGVRVYDGEDKTSFDYGKLILTTHKLIWRDAKDQRCIIALPLALIVYTEEQPSGFARSPKIVCHLSAAPPNKPSGPATQSSHAHVRFSFKEAGETEFYRCLLEELQHRRWEHVAPVPQATQNQAVRKTRAGIVGIERSMKEKHRATDKNISVAFEDLSKLMEKAKEMVHLSKSIANKIKEKQGNITEDETIRFKSYLLSMGIPDPVTRETHGSGDNYYKELAKQLASMLEQPIEDCGGMMTLTDVYCRVNRARGMELLSPEDLVNACFQLESLKKPVRLREFDSGVLVLQLQSHSEQEIIHNTKLVVESAGCLTAEELSRSVGVSVVLAKERLLVTEKSGEVCRDETSEGLKFYPNLFLKQPVS